MMRLNKKKLSMVFFFKCAIDEKSEQVNFFCFLLLIFHQNEVHVFKNRKRTALADRLLPFLVYFVSLWLIIR